MLQVNNTPYGSSNFFITNSGEVVEIVYRFGDNRRWTYLGLVHKANGRIIRREFSNNGIAKLGSNPNLDLKAAVSPQALVDNLRLSARAESFIEQLS